MTSASGSDRVEVVSNVQCRHRWSSSEEFRAVEEATPGMTVSYIARKHGIAPSLLCNWRRLMTGGLKGLTGGDLGALDGTVAMDYYLDLKFPLPIGINA